MILLRYHLNVIHERFFYSWTIRATTPIFLHVKIWNMESLKKKNQIFLSTGFSDIWLQT